MIVNRFVVCVPHSNLRECLYMQVTNEQVSSDVAELLEGAGFGLSTNDRDISDIMR